MKTLSNSGKKVARRSFAALMAASLCVTGFGTNFWGYGSKDASSISGNFEAFAAEDDADENTSNSVMYGPNETYYDAGTLVMNAYYDTATGAKLDESTANYRETDWDVTNATSYVANATQNGNQGVTIISTTDIADEDKYGTASNTSEGGDGKRGIMCFSEYLDELNGSSRPGSANYKAYEKSVPDYEAPAANDTVTYQYIAEGKTQDAGDGKTEIKWTLFAWPNNQNLDKLSASAVKTKLDTCEEIKAEWENIQASEVTSAVSQNIKVNVPGELVSKTTNAFQDAGKAGAKDTTSLFYKGQPEWFSGNRGSFDSWDSGNKADQASDRYLMGAGLWSRIETSAIRLKDRKDANGNSIGITVEGTPSEDIALYKPSNPSDQLSGADIRLTLGESNDTTTLPLYSYLNDTYAKEDALQTMALNAILSGQTKSKLAVIPTYNIRRQLYSLWQTTQASFLKGANTLTCYSRESNSTKTWSGTHITGVRLYEISSSVSIDTQYASNNAQYIANSVELSSEDGIRSIMSGGRQWNSAYQNNEPYGSDPSLVYFVFNENDVNRAQNIVHIDNIPGQVFNFSDVYSYYTGGRASATATKVAEDVPNTIIPYVVRSDAYYDVTEGYQRAAGVLYGRVDAPEPVEIKLSTSAINNVTAGKNAIANKSDKITDTVTYENLVGGDDYVLKGAIYESTDVNFENPISTAETSFTAAASSGKVNVVFGRFDSTEYAGKKLVVTEVLYDSNRTEVAKHVDLNDANQTITYARGPIINTAASLSADMKRITDTITYAGFDTKTQYIITTTVYDATTQSMLPDTITTDFKPTTENGKTDVIFDQYDPAALADHTLVLYESIATVNEPDVVIASHKDKNDPLQTVVVSIENTVTGTEITTNAVSGTGSKYLDAIDGETIVDTVKVTGLNKSTQYSAKATLYDATTNAMVTDAQNKILEWKSEFGTDANGDAEFFVTIDNFAASDKAGHVLVVHEDIIDMAGDAVLSHADNEDADQTVTVSIAGITTILGNKDGGKEVDSSSSTVLRDEISYTGLVAGNRYYMVSTLVDKETGETLKDSLGNESVITSTVFNANTTGTNQGSASFTCANMEDELKGKTIVAYNDLYRVLDETKDGETVTSSVKAELVASEHDLENKDQTVIVDATIDVTPGTPSDVSGLKTVAKSVDGKKTIPLAVHSVIKDTVSYKDLEPGKTYTLTADVYDVESGQRAVGYTKVQSMDFAVSDTGKGDVVMTIDVDTTELAEHDLVVYETLKLSDKVIAEHKNIKDKDQTVTVASEYSASIDTVATNKSNGSKTMPVDAGAVILDTVSYDGLELGQAYTLTSTVYNKATGKECKDIKPVVTNFTPEATSSDIDIEIPVDGTKYTNGESLVVYEELALVRDAVTTVNPVGARRSDSGVGESSTATDTTTTIDVSNPSNTTTDTTTVSAAKSIVIAEHKDISDADQTVSFVKMTTYLTGDGSASKTVHAGSDAYVIDTASFTGLTPNNTYVITTQLVDVAAGSQPVTIDASASNDASASGSAVATRTMEFTPTTANGSIATQINVDTKELSGHSLVAIATVTDKASGETIATHNDTGNTDQTIMVQTRVEAQTGVERHTWIFGLIAMLMLSVCGSYAIGTYSDKKNNR